MCNGRHSFASMLKSGTDNKNENLLRSRRMEEEEEQEEEQEDQEGAACIE